MVERIDLELQENKVEDIEEKIFEVERRIEDLKVDLEREDLDRGEKIELEDSLEDLRENYKELNRRADLEMEKLKELKDIYDEKRNDV